MNLDLVQQNVVNVKMENAVNVIMQNEYKLNVEAIPAPKIPKIKLLNGSCIYS